MGSNEFQKEFIEFLQEQNTELLNRLNHMKEKYENNILSKEINKHYITSVLEEMLSICTTLPQEIDIFYDKITAALSAFKDILLRKSEIVLMAEKITKVINPSGKFDTDLVQLAGPSEINEHISASRASKKVGTVKVSPMINGHVISTEPKIYLSRVPGEFTPGRRNESRRLSPILEASPDTLNDSSSLRSNIFKEIEIPLERINLKNKLSKQSPKTRFNGPKTWRKSISSLRCHSESRGKNVFFGENDNLNKNLSVEENANDPLEGPSWLYDQNSGMKSSLGSFMDYRRRKRRYASMFCSPEDYFVYTEDRVKKTSKGEDKFYEDHEKTDDESVSGSSDFIYPSLTSDYNNSSFKKRSGVSKRRPAKETNISDSLESERNSRGKTSNFRNSKRNSKKSSSSDSSDEGDNKENSFRRLSKVREQCRKLSLKSSVEEMSKNLSFERTPSRSRCDELESGTNTSTPDMQMASTSGKVIKEMLVKLDDCLSVKESHHRRSITNGSNKKGKFKRKKAENKSNSPAVILAEDEGRKKRKAAPSFKLVEPPLNVYVSKED